MTKPRHHESQLQRACVRWFRLQYPEHLIFAIPNGGRRSRIEAAIMQGEGVTAGVPDLQIVTPGKTFFVEMKAGAGKLTASQKDMHEKLRSLGFSVHTCHCIESFVIVVELEIRKPKISMYEID
jgi:hypothetical protein